jgi:Adenylosuccinate synthase
MVVTKLDVLSGLPKIKICTGYMLNGSVINHLPFSSSDYEKAVPLYEETQGWSDDISQIKDFKDLPVNAQKYILRIEELTGLKINMLSIGKERMQIINLKNIF